MSKSRGNVVEPWDVIDRHGADAFRWYYFASQQPWAGYRFSVETVGEAVRQFLLTLWNTYSFWVLYANAEGLEPASCLRAEAGPPASGRERHRARPLGLSRLQRTIAEVREQMDGFDCTTPAARSPTTSTSSPTGTCGSTAAASGTATAAAFATLRHCLGRDRQAARAVHALHRRRDLRQPLSASETGLRAGRRVDRRAGLGPPLRLPRGRREPDRRRSSRPAWTRSAARSSSAARRAPRRRSSSASRCARRWSSPPTPSARRSSGSPRWSPPSSTSRSSTSSAGGRARLLPGQAQLPLARAALRQGHAAGRGGGRGARRRRGRRRARARRRGRHPIDGKDHTLTADDINLVMEPLEGYQVEAEAGHAVALELDLDDELRREGLAREVVRAVQKARKQAGLEVSDRIALELGGDDELLDAAREHEAYVAGETLATSVDYGADGAGEKRHDRGPRAPHRRQQGLSGADGSPRSSSTWTASCSTPRPSGTRSQKRVRGGERRPLARGGPVGHARHELDRVVALHARRARRGRCDPERDLRRGRRPRRRAATASSCRCCRARSRRSGSLARRLAARARLLLEPARDRPGPRGWPASPTPSRRRSPRRRSSAASRRPTSISRPRGGSRSSPRACVAIEDSTNGIRSAHAAGMAVIAVPNRDFPPEPDALALAARRARLARGAHPGAGPGARLPPDLVGQPDHPAGEGAGADAAASARPASRRSKSGLPSPSTTGTTVTSTRSSRPCVGELRRDVAAADDPDVAALRRRRRISSISSATSRVDDPDVDVLALGRSSSRELSTQVGLPA